MNPLRSWLRLALAGACALAAPGAVRAVEETVTHIKSDGQGEMVSTDKETIITFRDNVVLTGTNLKLTCDYLEIVVLRTGDKTATIGKIDKFRSLLATGHVHIVQGDREAACGRAVVLPQQDRIVLTDNPVITDRGIATTMGEKITMLRGERRVIVDKPILTGPPLKDLGFDKNLKPAEAPAPAPATPAPPPSATPRQP